MDYCVRQVGAHDKMGMQVVPLKDLQENVPKLQTVPLFKNMDPNDEANSKKRGELTFEMNLRLFKEVSFLVVVIFFDKYELPEV